MTFDQLQTALATLQLTDRATLAEIKARHRALVKRYHPDGNPRSDEEKIRLINEAYRVLRDYCANYRFSFSREEFLEQNPEERLRDQFSEDSVWGG